MTAPTLSTWTGVHRGDELLPAATVHHGRWSVANSMRRVAALLCLGLVMMAHGEGARAEQQGGAAGPWERVSHQDGVVVERRLVDGSNLKEFVGRGVIDAPLGRVLAVIRDGTRRCEWMPNCAAAKMLEENVAERMQVAYHRTRAPWPVAHRDSVNRAVLRVEPARHRVVIEIMAIDYPAYPPPKGVVRMPFLRGHWILKPVQGGRATEAEYQIHANPGGILPDWLANLASKALPRATILGLRQQVKAASYPQFEAEMASSAEGRELMSNLP